MNLNSTVTTLVSYHGDSITFDAYAVNAITNAAVDITTAVVYFTVKKSLGDPESQAIVHDKSTDGTPVCTFTVTGALGKVTMTVPTAVTATLPIGSPTKLYFDVKVSLSANDMHTILSGTWVVNPAATTP